MRSIALSILSIILLLSLFGNAYLYYGRSVLVQLRPLRVRALAVCGRRRAAQLPPLALNWRSGAAAA